MKKYLSALALGATMFITSATAFASTIQPNGWEMPPWVETVHAPTIV